MLQEDDRGWQWNGLLSHGWQILACQEVSLFLCTSRIESLRYKGKVTLWRGVSLFLCTSRILSSRYKGKVTLSCHPGVATLNDRIDSTTDWVQNAGRPFDILHTSSTSPLGEVLDVWRMSKGLLPYRKRDISPIKEESIHDTSHLPPRQVEEEGERYRGYSPPTPRSRSLVFDSGCARSLASFAGSPTPSAEGRSDHPPLG